MLSVEHFVERLDVKAGRNHRGVFRCNRLDLPPKLLLNCIRTIDRGVQLRLCRRASDDVQPNFYIVAKQPQAFGIVRSRQQPCAQCSGSDGVRFFQESVAPGVEARHRHGESEAEHQRQQAEHGGLHGQHVAFSGEAACEPAADLPAAASATTLARKIIKSGESAKRFTWSPLFSNSAARRDGQRQNLPRETLRAARIGRRDISKRKFSPRKCWPGRVVGTMGTRRRTLLISRKLRRLGFGHR